MSWLDGLDLPEDEAHHALFVMALLRQLSRTPSGRDAVRAALSEADACWAEVTAELSREERAAAEAQAWLGGILASRK